VEKKPKKPKGRIENDAKIAIVDEK